MKQHINSPCRASFLELRTIASVHPSLSKNATARLVLSTIISRLDYWNATFADISSEKLLHLQKILTHATGLVMKRSKRDHITPLLKELHWLPLHFRSRYKLATLAYRHFDGSLPLVLFFLSVYLRTISHPLVL